jgi:hypothetical protein
MALTRTELQRFLPGVAIASLVMITVSVLLLVSLDTDKPPKAVMVVSRERVHPGELVILDARNSSDPDSESLMYRWSIDGLISSSSDRWVYIFPSTGNHTVELRVTDEKGATDTASLIIEVIPWPDDGAGRSAQEAINKFSNITT